MNQKKMQVLYLEQTGHILAVLTRTAAAESLFDVKGLAGTDLMVRNEKTNPSPLSPLPIDREESLSVPMDLLKAEIIDLNESAFVMPFNFMVGGGEANKIDPTGVPQKADQILTNNNITIKLTGTPVSEDTKAWVQIQERDPLPGSEPIRRIVTGIIKAQGSPVPGPPGSTSDGLSVLLDLKMRPNEDPAPIPSGTILSKKAYFVLVLVAGRKPGFFTLTLPA